MLRFMVNAQTMVQSLVRKDEGQDLLEYALLVALIALGAVAAVTLAGDKVEAVFNAIAGEIKTP
jgi:pilus assembly protein Flp/PilA